MAKAKKTWIVTLEVEDYVEVENDEPFATSIQVERAFVNFMRRHHGIDLPSDVGGSLAITDVLGAEEADTCA